MKKHISEETRIAILDAAWELIAEGGKVDASQSTIAAKAGVSRQTVYLAFGGRAGLLVAMLRNRDRHSGQVKSLHEIANGDGDRWEDFLSFVEHWLDYLPLIYPVGIQLDAAALNDEEAAAAWDDRMKRTLLHGMKHILARLQRAGRIAPGWTVDMAAETVWSLVHPANWRLLVIECGWSPDEFRRTRIEIIRRTLQSGS
ncbi:TetR/AcrR family transcriptional regulator [Mesorhizobium sp. YC-39]|uniref:TetR/AcrR family transcriptional regulator n=1 Tax=unclassified Mesorhizobium TaxID=325217 RepID=UPI0021E89DDE|nr:MULTISPECIES: TetR/AcrR family transcriptional regulator [unclassified Mesorhizobium]MCV3209282.1 TetR/AcrR family transcriptional regulator [Mesorhizobium sp. YC-2]MCV3231368.1 TetR/AcrR family transcriptional regulator [Mesorhizobium sp. YC-39]